MTRSMYRLSAREATGRAAEEERRAAVREEDDPPVPVAACPGRQLRAQARPVHAPRVLEIAAAEHGEELLEVEPSDGCDLQLQQRVLAGVHVHGVHVRRLRQDVVEHVAAGRRDGEDGVAPRQVQRDAVQTGIFPAGVVDEVVPLDQIEDVAVDVLDHGHGVAIGASMRPAGVEPATARRRVCKDRNGDAWTNLGIRIGRQAARRSPFRWWWARTAADCC